MEDRFRERYDSLRSVYEARIASLAGAVRGAAFGVEVDEVTHELRSNESTRIFAPEHLAACIEEHMAAENVSFLQDLTLRLADAKADLGNFQREHRELSIKLASLEVGNIHAERESMQVINVTMEVQEIRREYQEALEQASRESQRLKGENSALSKSLVSSTEERLALAERIQVLQTKVTDTQAMCVAVETKSLEVSRLERELCDEKTSNGKLRAKVDYAKDRIMDLDSRHQELKFQALSLNNCIKERDKRLKSFQQQKSESEVRFRNAVTHMESLMDAEAKESSSVVKELRDKAQRVKERLVEEVKQERAASAQLSKTLDQARLEVSELVHNQESTANAHNAALSAGIAREGLLQKELSHCRSQLEVLGQSLAEIVREKHELIAKAASAKAATKMMEATNLIEFKTTKESVMHEERPHTTSVSVSTSPSRWVKSRDWIERDSVLRNTEFLADKLEEANVNISQLKGLLCEEVQRRETAEQDVSSAQASLDISRQELAQLKELGDRLEEMGNNSLTQVLDKDRTIAHLESRLCELQETCSERNRDKPAVHRQHDVFVRQRMGRGVLQELSTLRSSLGIVKAQVQEKKEAMDVLVTWFAKDLESSVQRLQQSFMSREQLHLQYIAQADSQHKQDNNTIQILRQTLKDISATLFEKIGLSLPSSLLHVQHSPTDQGGCGSESIGTCDDGLAELMVSLESAVELREQCVTQPLLDQIELLEREKPTTVATVVGTEKGGISQEIPQKTADPSPGSICCSGTRSSSKDMEWGERGMDDLSMLAKLQKDRLK